MLSSKFGGTNKGYYGIFRLDQLMSSKRVSGCKDTIFVLPEPTNSSFRKIEIRNLRVISVTQSSLSFYLFIDLNHRGWVLEEH